jgi:hypothetical protein
MRNINCKPHRLAICCLSRIFYFFLERQFRSQKTIWWILSVNHANNNLCTWQNAFSMHYIHKPLIHHLSIGGWFKRMELIEVKSLIWAQKGKLYIIYENVMWIQRPTIPVWLQKKRYCSDMPNVVSAIDGTSHEIQIPSIEPQQKAYFQQSNSFHWLIWKESL